MRFKYIYTWEKINRINKKYVKRCKKKLELYIRSNEQQEL